MKFDKFRFFEAMRYKPHAGQVNLHRSCARFRILACGARWGKTTAAAYEICAAMLDQPDTYWCVGPIYSIANVIFKKILHIWLNNRPDFVEKYSESERYIKLINGAECHGKTADNPASLLAVGVKGMVLDEPALMKEEVWQVFLQSRLNDKKGWALFTGTPKGKGWYWLIFKRGKEPGQDDYWSTEGPTWQNPCIDKEWLLSQRPSYTEKGWAQEVLGAFIDDQGAVFRDIRGKDRIRGAWNSETNVADEPIARKIYSVGADLAKHQDWSVITVLDAQGHLCFWERLPQGMGWPSQRARILAVSQKYNNATCYIDSSGIGDPVLDDLRREKGSSGGHSDRAGKDAAHRRARGGVREQPHNLPGHPYSAQRA